MLCYNCGLKIHNTNAKDCHYCGVKLGAACSSCKTPNPPMAKFCCQCGSQLAGSFEGSSVQNYSVLLESRKNVAVLFADVSGFTALSEKLDPEIVREIINDCFSYITAPVYELGGMIDKYIGDCVMVLFGAKSTHIDDAKRAVMCAVRMSKLIKDFSEERLKSLGFELKLSIGVHYGLVVTGGVGNYYDMDYTVMGDTVNTAQRIQANTPKSCIYVSDAIYKETCMDIEYSEPLELRVKNKENPIICYAPLHIKNPYSSEKEQLPVVGRLDVMKQLFEALKTSEQKPSCIAGVIGPAGMGKTTLIEEFLKLCKDEVKVVRTECGPSLMNSPYSLINKILMNIMNISQGEALIVKQSRIISYISFILAKYDEETVKRNYQFISFLMGIEIDKETKQIISSMDAKGIYREISNQLLLLFHEFENKFRSLILIEDIHWSDEKSIALLKEVWMGLAAKNGSNLYVYTSRNTVAEFEQLNIENSRHIDLIPLDRSSVTEYIKLYIGCDAIDSGLADHVCSFSGGNPLYMYELLKYIKRNALYYVSDNTGYLRNTMERIPNSLQGLILSKLNYLAPEAIEIAQAGSVIGKDFTLSVINRLLKKDIEAGPYLKEAINSNILYQKNTYTYAGRKEKLYSFTHDTERETIYNSILNKNKLHYHREIAKVIEMLYAKNIESYYEVLGEHCEKGGEYAKAADHYTNAAHCYKKLSNTQEALSYFLKAYNCVSKLKHSDSAKQYNLCTEIGELYSILSEFKNAKNYLSKALKYAESFDDQLVVQMDLARIYKEQSKFKEAMSILDDLQSQMKQSHKYYGSLLFLKCSIQRVIGQPQEALSNIRKAEVILKKNKDYENLTKVLNAAGVIYHTTGDIENALNQYLESYKYAEKTGDLQTLMKCAGNMATIFHIKGDISSAMKYFNSARELSKKISHKQGYITSSNNLGIMYMDKGMFSKAKTYFEEAIRISKETSAFFLLSASLSNLADIEYYVGDYKAAKRYACQALELSKEIEDIEGQGINSISLAKINIEQGRLVSAKSFLDAAHNIYRDINSEDGWSDYYYYLAQYKLEMGDLQSAVEHAEHSKASAVRCQNTRKHAKALRLLGILQQRLKDYAASLPYLDASIELLDKEDASYELVKSLYMRAISYHNLGDAEAAQKDHKAAASAIAKIDKCKWTKIIEHGIN